MVNTLDTKWHKLCFKCEECDIILKIGKENQHNDKLYCQNCHRGKMFGPKGVWTGQTVGCLSDESLKAVTKAGASNLTSVLGEKPSNSLSTQERNHTPTFGGAPKCKRCNKRVYAAEMVTALDSKWHKLCFKCEECDKLLETGKETVHDEKSYCQNCHGKIFGPKGVGTWATAGCLSTEEELKQACRLKKDSIRGYDESPTDITKSSASSPSSVSGGEPSNTYCPQERNHSLVEYDKCVACQETVRPLEKMIFNDKIYHRMCVKCVKCDHVLENGSVLKMGAALFCINCYNVKMNDGNKKASQPPIFEEAPTCRKCSKSVYAAEMVTALDSKWHKVCFKCEECHKMLESGKENEHYDKLYCQNCHVKSFGPKDVVTWATAGCFSTDEELKEACLIEPERCVTCRESVHGANKMMVNNNIYHRRCVKCIRCDHFLEDGSVLTLGEVFFCLNCYNIEMCTGKKRVNKPPVFREALKCRKCDQNVYSAEMVTALDSKWHKLCFKCGECDKILESGKEVEYDDKPYCKSCHEKKFGRYFGAMYTAGPLSNSEELNKVNDSKCKNFNTSTKIIPISEFNKCVKCGDAVYAAEKMTAINKIYHKRCIKCASCEKVLDAGSVLGHGNDIYCLVCYNNEHAPSGLMRRGTHHESR